MVLKSLKILVFYFSIKKIFLIIPFFIVFIKLSINNNLRNIILTKITPKTFLTFTNIWVYTFSIHITFFCTLWISTITSSITFFTNTCKISFIIYNICYFTSTLSIPTIIIATYEINITIYIYFF